MRRPRSFSNLLALLLLLALTAECTVMAGDPLPAITPGKPGSSVAPSSATPSSALPATGVQYAEMRRFEVLMRTFLAENDIPGAAIAVSKDGRLVYARGFGYADAEQKQPVEPDSLFRVASISKPLTAVAVLQLVEKGKFTLETPVFDVLTDPRFRPATGGLPEELKQVRIRHLLQHTGGWDSEKSFDPMFRSVDIATSLHVAPPSKPEHVIRYMLGRKLDFNPGERYAYSNFGYCLLGRVIEQVSRDPYEDYVRKRVLAPLGISRMKIGRTLAGDRARGEVRYYAPEVPDEAAVLGPSVGKPVPHPYGAWCLETMDSHGGWIASAIDLVRFASSFDRPGRCRVLNEKSVAAMFARPDALAGFDAEGKPRDAYYGCGWFVRTIGNEGKMNTWHTGSLPGTSTILVRRHDGLNWAVLFNTRKPVNGQPPARAIDPLVHQAADAVKTWPTHDLFGHYR